MIEAVVLFKDGRFSLNIGRNKSRLMYGSFDSDMIDDPRVEALIGYLLLVRDRRIPTIGMIIREVLSIKSGNRSGFSINKMDVLKIAYLLQYAVYRGSDEIVLREHLAGLRKRVPKEVLNSPRISYVSKEVSSWV
ncbi:MAG: hypothetical protein FJ358_01500 [Thaumarchaeota archaeon]|nr:hypothetical protein [Nitrososphaerota archaeon]